MQTSPIWLPSSAQAPSPSRGVPVALAILFNVAVAYGFAVGIGVIPKLPMPQSAVVVNIPAKDDKDRQVEFTASDDFLKSKSTTQIPNVAAPDFETERQIAPIVVGDPIIDVQPGRVIDEQAVAPRLLSSVEPPYPSMSRLRDEEGIVQVRVTISPSGKVGEARIERSSGFPRLDEAALKAVQGWRFAPARRGEQAVVGSTVVQVRFELQRQG